jgi:hypothetical protein
MIEMYIHLSLLLMTFLELLKLGLIAPPDEHLQVQVLDEVGI